MYSVLLENIPLALDGLEFWPSIPDPDNKHATWKPPPDQKKRVNDMSFK